MAVNFCGSLILQMGELLCFAGTNFWDLQEVDRVQLDMKNGNQCHFITIASYLHLALVWLIVCRSAIINYSTIECIIIRVITGIFLTKLLRVNEDQFVNFDSGVMFYLLYFLQFFLFFFAGTFYADREKKAKIRTHKNLVPHSYSVHVRPRAEWIIPQNSEEVAPPREVITTGK